MITEKHTHAQIQAAIDAGGRVEFAPGVYENVHFRITKPVHLTGYGATLTGGARIEWNEVPDGVLSCDAPADQPVRELVVGGELRMRCRLPETGYMKHLTDYPYRWLGTTKGGWEVKPSHEQMVTMRVEPGLTDQLTLHSAEATVVHSWSDSLLTVERAAGDLVIFGQAGDHPVGGFGIKDYCLWNVPEAFEKPGTFYHDVPAGRLYYRPLPGETVETEAYLPEQTSIFYADEPVEQVEIEGFTLTAASAPRVKAGFGAYGLNGAIDLPKMLDSRLHHLTIQATGGYGIRSTGKVKNVRVDHCWISDTGAGGIRMVSEGGEYLSEISDCFVHHTGIYQPSAIGISSHNCHIRHNEVHHSSYSAVNCGGDRFIVEKNFLHDAMKVLNDGAAIYSFGSHDGIMRENLVSGIRAIEGHNLRIAYYLDEVSSGWLVERNVADDCDFPNHNHMCGAHRYRENIFVNESGPVRLSLQRISSPISYIGNVISADGGISVNMNEGALGIFEENRFCSVDGGILLRVHDWNDLLEERPLEIGESNRSIEAVHFEKNARVFEAGGVKIDLTDVGPRA